MGYKISTLQEHATREHRPAQTWICWLDVWNKVKHILPNGGLFNGEENRMGSESGSKNQQLNKQKTNWWVVEPTHLKNMRKSNWVKIFPRMNM